MKNISKLFGIILAALLLASCGGGGGGSSAPATSDSLTGCWWVYTETTIYGPLKTEVNFDNSNMRMVAYLNDILQRDCYCPYTLSGNTITYNTANTVDNYVNGTVNQEICTYSMDYSIDGNSLTLSNGKKNGVPVPVAITPGSHSSIVLTRK